jgi:hypothetical protein
LTEKNKKIKNYLLDITMNNWSDPTLQGSSSGSAMPQNNSNNNAGQWPPELPPGCAADYMDELADYVDLANLIENLAVPKAGPSAAVPSAQPSDFPAPGQRPSSTTTKAYGNNKKKQHRGLTVEEIRQRRADRQKHYRDRQREEKIEVKNQLAVAAVEVEAARVEQDALLVQHTVLTKAAEYCSSSINAAQSLVSSSISKVTTEYQHAVEGLAWLGLQVYSPSDAQLHAFVDKRSMDDLEFVSENIIQRCTNLYARWEEEPAARENIEAQLQRIQSIRLRVIKYLAKTRPEMAIDLVTRRIMPPGADGAPNPKLEEAVAALNLTPEQLESFERQWVLYLQETESIRQEARSLISFLTFSSVKDSAASFCSIGAAGMFQERLQAVQELEMHSGHEAHAIISLQYWPIQHLSMQQKVTLMAHSSRYYPDLIQIGRILFGDSNGKDINSEKVYSMKSDS